MPLLIIRPGSVCTSAREPLPGWTDSTSLLTGAAILVGLGVFKDAIGNPNNIADIIPVDFVSR